MFNFHILHQRSVSYITHKIFIYYAGDQLTKNFKYYSKDQFTETDAWICLIEVLCIATKFYLEQLKKFPCNHMKGELNEFKHLPHLSVDEHN